MRITIGNELVTVEVDTVGAELRRVYDRRHDDELLWPGDPAFWPGSAPVLFPIVGRLKGQTYTYQNHSYSMRTHGFARSLEFSVQRQLPDLLTLSLGDSPQTLAQYPFRFRLELTFRLEGAQVRVEYRVWNSGDEAMYFTLGSHPGVALPVQGAPYRVAFSEIESLDLFRIRDEVLTTSGKPFLQGGREIVLASELFVEDALIFKDIRSKTVRVCDRDGRRVVRIDTGGAPHLGIWTKPGAPYICIEPWFSYDDPADVSGRLEEKPGILRLEAGAEFRTFYTFGRE